MLLTSRSHWNPKPPSFPPCQLPTHLASGRCSKRVHIDVVLGERLLLLRRAGRRRGSAPSSRPTCSTCSRAIVVARRGRCCNKGSIIDMLYVNDINIFWPCIIDNESLYNEMLSWSFIQITMTFLYAERNKRIIDQRSILRRIIKQWNIKLPYVHFAHSRSLSSPTSSHNVVLSFRT